MKRERSAGDAQGRGRGGGTGPHGHGRNNRSENRRLGPAAAAMRLNRHNVYRDGREAEENITVDALLSDAVAMQRFHAPASGGGGSARLLIYSREELAVYRQKRRAELEERVKRGYKLLGNWIKFARWEAQQRDYGRMRDVLQRAVHFHGDDPALWRDYAELEATHGFVAEARAVWSRGVTSLPASTDLWLKYLVFEQAAAAGGGGGGSSGAPLSLAGATPAEAAVRDVFNRWLAVPTGVPACAYELYALYEAQRGHQDACYEVTRRYLEAHNSPEAWMFAARAALDVFGDGARALALLEAALEALPGALLWGPLECRVPLARARVLAELGRVAEAREAYHHLLQRVSASTYASPTAASGAVAALASGRGEASPPAASLEDDVLTAYSHFERLHADAASGARLSRLEAQKAYERRLAHDATDYDAWLSLYLLLREAAAAGDSGGAGPDAASQEAREERARDCLTRALATPARAVAANPHAAQQRAVLVMEYARVCERAGRPAEARAALTAGIRAFPFEVADCPRLWLEAASFELRQGDWDTARTLLRAGAKASREGGAVPPPSASSTLASTTSTVTPASAQTSGEAGRQLFDAALRLEEAARDAGVVSVDDYLTRVRTLHEEAIRVFPLDDALWVSFARVEEQAGQPARAHALYAACVRALTAEAGRVASFTHRYVLLGRVDAVWARRLALQRRLLKRARAVAKRRPSASPAAAQATPSAAGAAGERIVAGSGSAELDGWRAAEEELHRLYAALLRGVWADYVYEAVAWRAAFLAAPPPPPPAPPAAPTVEATEDGAVKATSPAVATELPFHDAPPPVTVPRRLPEALGPARARWSDAVSAVEDFMTGSPGKSEGDDGAGLLKMRAIFAALLEEERGTMRRTLGWVEDTSFDAARSLQQWVDLLLQPLTKAWADFEATHGGSLEVVQQHTAAPVKRRTRLLRGRNQ